MTEPISNQTNISFEVVIKGLKCCTNYNVNCKAECPYYGAKPRPWMDCFDVLKEDALALLKEQEPVAPIFDYDGRDVWLCGNCHRTIFHPTRTDEDENEKNYRRFCFHCGRAVKWYDA